MTQDDARLVLVVEDDPSVRHALVKFLDLRGFGAIAAETVEEGLAALGRHRFVAVVVGVRVRQDAGREIIAAVPPDVPVIVFAEVPSEAEDLEAVRPHTRLIEKPHSLVLLIETLEDMVAARSSQDLHS